MSSLEDGFGGGADDMASANTRGELRNLFWEVGYHGFTLCATLSCQCANLHGAILQIKMAQNVLC